MSRRSGEDRSEPVAAGPFATLLSRARAQSHELADQRAAQLFPIALAAVAAPRRRAGLWAALPLPARPMWSLAAVCAALLLGGGGTWALVSGTLGGRAADEGASFAEPTLGAALAEACREAGPTPLARRSSPAAAAAPMRQQERAVVARAPAPTPRARPAAETKAADVAEAPARGKPTSVVLDGPQETIIIVAPPVKHKALWTPKDFSRYMRRRMGRDN